jgi:hypothetical protein
VPEKPAADFVTPPSAAPHITVELPPARASVMVTEGPAPQEKV